jgi:hypothetical protein
MLSFVVVDLHYGTMILDLDRGLCQMTCTRTQVCAMDMHDIFVSARSEL